MLSWSFTHTNKHFFLFLSKKIPCPSINKVVYCLIFYHIFQNLFYFKELTTIVKKCKNWTDCTSLTPQQFSVWLETNSVEAATMLKSIIQRYEHRNIKEVCFNSIFKSTIYFNCLAKYFCGIGFNSCYQIK